MQRPYHILATAPVEIMDEEGTVSAADWRALDGRVFDGEGECFLDEVSFDGEEGSRELLSGGYLHLEYSEEKGALTAVIEFHSSRPLTERECSGLVMPLEATLWDGLGDTIRWDHGLEWLAFGEITLLQEPGEQDAEPSDEADQPDD